MSANLCQCDHESYFHRPSCLVAGCKCHGFTPAPQAQPDASEGFPSKEWAVKMADQEAKYSSECGAGSPPEAQPDASEGAKEADDDATGFFSMGSRSWSDSGDNGAYQNLCYLCLKLFIGHKDRIICLSCFNATPDVKAAIEAATTDQAQEIARLKGEVAGATEAVEKLKAAHQAYIFNIRDMLGMKTPGDGFVEFLLAMKDNLAAAEKRAVEAEAKAEQMRAALDEVASTPSDGICIPVTRETLTHIIEAIAAKPSEAVRAVKLEHFDLGYKEGFGEGWESGFGQYQESHELSLKQSETRRALEGGK